MRTAFQWPFQKLRRAVPNKISAAEILFSLILCFVLQFRIMTAGVFNAEELLRRVSRSFYLTLRVLPCSVRQQLSCAYLLARAADTIADTQLVAVPRRLEALRQLRSGIQAACEDRTPETPDLGELAKAQSSIAGQGNAAERSLLEKAGYLLDLMRGFQPGDRQVTGRVLDTITRGQELDLIRFGEAAKGRITALGSDADLDHYAYCVAGCVGEFWTKMCRSHVFPDLLIREETLLANGVRFGKGLQLVNILRDLPEDLRRGRCYIPQDRLSEHGLLPAQLLDPAVIVRFRPLYDSYLKQAEEHLSAGWQYTAMLPFRLMRIRMACAWPALIGMKTLARLRSGNVLDAGKRIKLARSEIRRLIVRSTLLYPFPPAWSRLFEATRNESASPHGSGSPDSRAAFL